MSWILVALGAGVAVGVVVLAIVLGGRGHGPPPVGGNPVGPNPQPPAQQVQGYFNAAVRATTARDRACSGTHLAPAGNPGPARSRYSGRSPSRELLSAFGALRRSATPADRLPQPFSKEPLPGGGVVYEHYIRLARTFGRISYYLIAERVTQAAGPIPSRCIAEIQAALQRELRPLPAAKRKAILRSLPKPVPVPSGPYDGIATLSVNGGGPAAPRRITRQLEGPVSIAAFEQHGDIATDGSVAYGIAPDGVATVVLTFPGAAGNVTVTTSVINNFFVTHTAGTHPPIGMVWRSPSGAVIKRFNLNQ